MASAKKKIKQFNTAVAQKQYETNLNNYYSQEFQNKVKKDLTDSQAKDTWKRNMQIRDIQENAKLEAYEKSEQTFVDQLIFNEEAAKVAREGEDRVFQERILETAFQTDELNLQFEKQVTQSKFEYGSQEQNIKNAITDFETNQALIDLQTDKSKSDVEFGLKQADQKESDARADSNTKQYQNRIRALQDTGQARAQGRRGNSAAKALQSITALSGVNSALIADQLTRSELSINTDREILKATYNKDTQSGFALRQQQVSTRQASDRKTQTVTSANRSKEYVAETLGMSEEQFNMSREQLGNSLLSAADTYEANLKKVNRQKYASDLQTYANRQLKPRVAMPYPKPFESELPINIMPPRPVEPVRGAGATAQATGSSTAGIITGVAGTVATVAAAFGPAGAPVAAGAAIIGGIASIFS